MCRACYPVVMVLRHRPSRAHRVNRRQLQLRRSRRQLKNQIDKEVRRCAAKISQEVREQIDEAFRLFWVQYDRRHFFQTLLSAAGLVVGVVGVFLGVVGLRQRSLIDDGGRAAGITPRTVNPVELSGGTHHRVDAGSVSWSFQTTQPTVTVVRAPVIWLA